MGDFTVNVRQKPMDFNRWQLGLLQAELCKGQDSEESPLVTQKKHIFEQVVATVHNCFDENFPE